MIPPDMREEWIIRQARERPAAERAAFLDGACAGDVALRQRLEALLAAHEQSAATLATEPEAAWPTIKLDFADALDEAVGQTLGRYKLLERVGEGGCGVVYVAEQTEPVRRRVALKVIKLGMDTKQVVARFEAERQALAMMDHPNIAKVLDAGTTDLGRPFFVMELVRGIRITDYCDQNNLTTKERLDLFIKVCQAIQHAHQKGIIHRDIKPSNILVTMQDGVPVPKVIDFGIAKATEGRLTEATVYTQLNQFIGTPAYMSPEQAEMSGLDIDTRSDIYSLGVLLYELLAGSTPFDAKELMASGIDAMRKTIRENEPVRPSTRLATLKGEELTTTAKRRSSDAPKLIYLLQGDLDWIVMKCLEKDRTRRYETANGLAADLKRHLNNEPVLARPPSASYRFRKLVRRNKLAFAAAASVVIALIVGLTIATWMFVRERQAHYRTFVAEREQSRLREESQRDLYHSLVGQARATRLARRMGYREEVFKLLQQARDLHVPQKDLAELRREAVACLGDFVGLTPTTFSDFPTNSNIQGAVLDSTGKLAAFAMSNGAILLREMPSGKEIASLIGMNNPISVCFNSAGDQLFWLRWPTAGTWEQRIAEVRLYVWGRDAHGGWRETENTLLPGAVDFLSSTAGVFVQTMELASPSGVLAGRPDVKCKLLDLKTRTAVPGFEMTNTMHIALSPDGRFLATETAEVSSANKSFLDIWDFKTSQRLNRQGPLGREASLKFSLNGKYLSYLSASGGAIYTMPGLQVISDFKEFFNSSAAFANDRIALQIYHQNRIRLWNLVKKEDIAFLDEPETTWPLAFAPDGSFLLTYNMKRPWIYRLDTGEKLSLPAHADAVTGIAFSPDGTRIASVSKDRVVRVCDATTGRKIWEADSLPGPGQCVSYSPAGQWLVTGDFETHLVWIWDAHTGERLLELGTNEVGQTMSAEFSPDGRYLATVRDNGISIWRIERGTTGEAQGGLDFKLAKSPPGHGESLVFSPDSRYLAFHSYEQAEASLDLWEFDAATQPHRVTTDILPGVQSLSFTPDSRHLSMMGTNSEIVTLDVATGKRTSSFPTGDSKGAREYARNFRLSPDGSMLAFDTRSVLGVEVWDPKTGNLLYALPEENGTVYWLAWSPDSQRLAVSRDNGDIAIWNLKDIKQVLAKLGLNP